MLVWGPRNGFDSCKVLSVLLDGTQTGMVPNKKLERQQSIDNQ